MDTIQFILSRFPNGGYFVEAGAHDGVGDSQTYKLEQTGKWTGLCIEPSSAYNGLKRHRKCNVSNCCLGPVDGERVIFREVTGNAIELSGILSHFGDHWDRETRPHKDRELEATSLTTILQTINAPSTIEFLSLDTEGSELAILSAHDFERYRFHVMLIEHNRVEARKEALRKLLEPKGYYIRGDDGTNFLFY